MFHGVGPPSAVARIGVTPARAQTSFVASFVRVPIRLSHLFPLTHLYIESPCGMQTETGFEPLKQEVGDRFASRLAPPKHPLEPGGRSEWMCYGQAAPGS